MFPCAQHSINSTKIPITYPVASTTNIGATVTMLTSIIDGCSVGSFEKRAAGGFYPDFLSPESVLTCGENFIT